MDSRHPLHPALVHFPVACWSLGTAADVASLRYGTSMAWLGGVLLVVGTVMALPAMLAGLYEFTRIREGSPALRTAWIHMGAMLAAFSLYLASVLLRAGHLQLHPPRLSSIGLDCAGFLAMAIGGWQGGKLVYHHGTGTRTPCD